jgi:small subunit ribosomal protein S27Ae|tara:strand:- start:655 stop:981 length:327 start_codon:yes stop_codon:yes gene_type:complete
MSEENKNNEDTSVEGTSAEDTSVEGTSVEGTSAEDSTEAPPKSSSKKSKSGPAKKKVNPQIWKFYSIDGDSVSKSKRDCPRCGKGVFMAEHSDRFTCGKCNYTTFKTN